MVRYWAMAPTMHGMNRWKVEAEGATFDERWEYDLRHGVISVGWDFGKAPDSRDDITRLWLANTAPGSRDRGNAVRVWTYFWFDIQPGDMVIARAGVNKYVGVGVFRGDPWYDENAYAGTNIEHYHSFRRVYWTPDSGPRRASPVQFGRNTLYPLTPDKVAVLRSAGVLPAG